MTSKPGSNSKKEASLLATLWQYTISLYSNKDKQKFEL